MVRWEVAKGINGEGIGNAFNKSKVYGRAAITIMVGREGRSNYIKFSIIGEILNKGTIIINTLAVPIPVVSVKVSENNSIVAERI